MRTDSLIKPWFGLICCHRSRWKGWVCVCVTAIQIWVKDKEFPKGRRAAPDGIDRWLTLGSSLSVERVHVLCKMAAAGERIIYLSFKDDGLLTFTCPSSNSWERSVCQMVTVGDWTHLTLFWRPLLCGSSALSPDCRFCRMLDLSGLAADAEISCVTPGGCCFFLNSLLLMGSLKAENVLVFLLFYAIPVLSWDATKYLTLFKSSYTHSHNFVGYGLLAPGGKSLIWRWHTAWHSW